MQVRLLAGSIVDTFGLRCYCSSSSKWDIFAALCLERRPIIVPEMNIIEKAMHNLTLNYENSRSLLSDHEVKMIRDKERLERLSSGAEVSSEDFDQAALETAQEFEDKFNEELKKLELAPRKTKDDETSNFKSLNRCLDHRLLFFINSQVGNHDKWTLPFVKIDKQSSLRQAIDELTSQLFPENQLTLRVLGNAPLAVYTYKYGAKNRKTLGATGAKVFILKAYHLNGTPQMVESNKSLFHDYKWLTINESRKIIPSAFWKVLRRSHVIDTVPENVVKASLAVVTRKKEESKVAAHSSN
ncbi:39S ribosomal protein L46, mitochondrial-like [Panonychus citri]|uniref:39S ribosomal protein L46, mitochondrial-like n=1 Tax=Panonychus citri TaxID=50023 RepID=UPI0023071265|nr:39S ribosomal protein L46, mitochondrial-like [Panonychus citri]